MEELFTMLSSSARLDKCKHKKKRSRHQLSSTSNGQQYDDDNDIQQQPFVHVDEISTRARPSRDRTGKRDTSENKRQLVHKEQMAAFRRSMAIRVSNKNDPDLPDAISSFDEIIAPSWWKGNNRNHGRGYFGGREDDDDDEDENDDMMRSVPGFSFQGIVKAIQRNVENGRWKEPTPIQMQAIPTLLERRDMIGAAPTGSGKSGAFIIPALLLSGAPYNIYYNTMMVGLDRNTAGDMKTKQKQKRESKLASSSRQGEIRSLLLAPSRELAVQLHREVERLGMGRPGGISSLLLSKSNSASVVGGTAGGTKGIDVMVSTPLRLVDALDKGLRLDSIRLVVLDEADRLLDAADGKLGTGIKEKNHSSGSNIDSSEESSDEENDVNFPAGSSGSARTFLAQMDHILSSLPASATRALFSATVGPTVKTLAENILRNPVDIKIAVAGSFGGANTDIEQELMFVGREEGKLLAMRQLKHRGDIKPPAIVFVQSQDRAQALFGELLYDGMHVDVIHAGRSRTARDNAVAKFRKGETWVLICTDLVARGVDFRAVNMVINYDLPTSGITYVHRIGRTGRAGRKGKAITLFTEADFDNLRTIANVMKQSGCKVEDWMLQLKKSSKNRKRSAPPPRRASIDTTPKYDKKKRFKKKQIIQESKRKKEKKDGVEKKKEDTKG